MVRLVFIYLLVQSSKSYVVRKIDKKLMTNSILNFLFVQKQILLFSESKFPYQILNLFISLPTTNN